MNVISNIAKYSFVMSSIGFTSGMLRTNNIKQNVLDMSQFHEYPKNDYVNLLRDFRPENSLSYNKKRIFSGLNLQLKEENLNMKDRLMFSSKYSLDCLVFPAILFMNIEINKLVDKNGEEYHFKYFTSENNNNFITSSSLF